MTCLSSFVLLLSVVATGWAGDCTVYHDGDLVVEEDQVFEIRDCVFCQRGNVLVRDNGVLRVENADLVMEAVQSGTRRVELSDTARLEMSQARIVSPDFLEVAFDDSSSALISDASEVDWFHAHDFASVEVRGSLIGDFHLHHNASVQVYDSDVVSATLLVDGLGRHIFSDLKPGFIGYWSLESQEPESGLGYRMELTNTTVESWSLLSTADVEVLDSGLFRLEINGGGTYSLHDVTVSWLIASGFQGALSWDHGSLLRRMTFQDSSFVWSGVMEAHAAQVQQWQSTAVVRNYPVLVQQLSGNPCPSAELVLYDPGGQQVWSGTTDSAGEATIAISFDDDCYAEGWTLVVPELGASARVTLSSDTPLLVSSTPRGDVTGDGVVDIVDLRLALQVAMGAIQGTAEQREAADVDGDGDVDLEDVRVLAEHVLHL